MKNNTITDDVLITLSSTAKNAYIAAHNAVMLAQDTAQTVILQWQGSEVIIFPLDTVEGAFDVLWATFCADNDMPPPWCVRGPDGYVWDQFWTKEEAEIAAMHLGHGYTVGQWS